MLTASGACKIDKCTKAPFIDLYLKFAFVYFENKPEKPVSGKYLIFFSHKPNRMLDFSIFQLKMPNQRAIKAFYIASQKLIYWYFCLLSTFLEVIKKYSRVSNKRGATALYYIVRNFFIKMALLASN